MTPTQIATIKECLREYRVVYSYDTLRIYRDHVWLLVLDSRGKLTLNTAAPRCWAVLEIVRDVLDNGPEKREALADALIAEGW